MADGQDPTSLEARLAFHLHRLNLTGAPLREALQSKGYLATALSQGRIAIEMGFLSEMATALNIAADEITRPLLEDETSEWSFYRRSAQNRQAVWENVMAIAQRHDLSIRDTAEAIGMDFADLANAVSGKRPRILQRGQAQILAALESPPQHPDTLLPTQVAFER